MLLFRMALVCYIGGIPGLLSMHVRNYDLSMGIWSVDILFLKEMQILDFYDILYRVANKAF